MVESLNPKVIMDREAGQAQLVQLVRVVKRDQLVPKETQAQLVLKGKREPRVKIHIHLDC